MQAIRAPNYDFRKLQTGQLLEEVVLATESSAELASSTGFLANNFAVFGYDNDKDNNEIVQVISIDSPVLTISTLTYQHRDGFLVYPSPYDIIELYKQRRNGEFQLLEKKVMDVDGPYTIFVDPNPEKTDRYRYRYSNSVTDVTSDYSMEKIEYVKTKEPYVTPEEVVEYMKYPDGIDECDPNVIMLCDAYSDLLDHTIGRFQNERLWHHYKKVVIPMDKVSSFNKVRMKIKDARPVVEVLEAHIVNPITGASIEIEKPYEVFSQGVVHLPGLDLSMSWNDDDNDRLHLLLKVGYFESSAVPADIRKLLLNVIAMHLRNEDMIKRYVHHTSDFVSGERTSDAFVRTITTGKYTKQWFETAAEGSGQRISSKALETIGVSFDAAMIKNNRDVFKTYMENFSISFL